VSDATNQVSTMRAQLGAFVSTTLQTNINTLNGTVLSLTSAQSNIQDADFAAESASFTRAQILVQSATSVLSVANQNPQNVLALLKNL
jgi:flagellin